MSLLRNLSLGSLSYLEKVCQHDNLFNKLCDLVNVLDVTSVLMSSLSMQSCIEKAERHSRLWVQRCFEQSIPQLLPLGLACWRQMMCVIKVPLLTGPTAFADGRWWYGSLRELLLHYDSVRIIELLPGIHELGHGVVRSYHSQLKIRGICSGVSLSVMSFKASGTLHLDNLTIEQIAPWPFRSSWPPILLVEGHALYITHCLLSAPAWTIEDSYEFAGNGVVAKVSEIHLQDTRMQYFRTCLQIDAADTMVLVEQCAFGPCNMLGRPYKNDGHSIQPCWSWIQQHGYSGMDPYNLTSMDTATNVIRLPLDCEPAWCDEYQTNVGDAALGTSFQTGGVSNMLNTEPESGSLVAAYRSRRFGLIHTEIGASGGKALQAGTKGHSSNSWSLMPDRT